MTKSRRVFACVMLYEMVAGARLRRWLRRSAGDTHYEPPAARNWRRTVRKKLPSLCICCCRKREERPSMKQVVVRLEELGQRHLDDRYYQRFRWRRFCLRRRHRQGAIRFRPSGRNFGRIDDGDRPQDKRPGGTIAQDAASRLARWGTALLGVLAFLWFVRSRSSRW